MTMTLSPPSLFLFLQITMHVLGFRSSREKKKKKITQEYYQITYVHAIKIFYCVLK
jgi:hypothetical protein